MSAPLILIGKAYFTGATGAVVAGGAINATVVRNGAGSYDVTLGNGGVDQIQAKITLTPENAAGIIAVVDPANSTDTVKRILCFSDAGAATDPTRMQVVVERSGMGT